MEKGSEGLPFMQSYCFCGLPLFVRGEPRVYLAQVGFQRGKALIHGTPEFIKTVVQCVYLDLNFEQLGCKKVLQNFTDVLDGTHRMTIYFTGSHSVEGLDRGGLIILHVEYRVQLRDLKQIMDFLSQVQQLQFAALVAHSSESTHQFADP